MFAMVISTKSYAQEVVVVKEQPPVPKVEVIEGPPAPGLPWISGHWKWKNDEWVWVKGRWSKPPIPTACGSRTTRDGVPLDEFIDLVAGCININILWIKKS